MIHLNESNIFVVLQLLLICSYEVDDMTRITALEWLHSTWPWRKIASRRKFWFSILQYCCYSITITWWFNVLYLQQFVNLTAASKCVREATKFHKVLEVMLAYGNYMNSGRKGAVYGFKISSLDTVCRWFCSRLLVCYDTG